MLIFVQLPLASSWTRRRLEARYGGGHISADQVLGMLVEFLGIFIRALLLERAIKSASAMEKSAAAGPSTSASSCVRTNRIPRRLKREELRARVAKRACVRYLVDDLDEGWLAGLISDGLIPEAARGLNDGLRPIYEYDYRSYRRALQIARLRAQGIVERDAIRVLFFAKRYSEHDIRGALWNQYSKFARRVMSGIRSGYIDNTKTIPTGHKTSLLRSLGELDGRLDEAGLRLPGDRYIEGLRIARRPAEELNQNRQTSNLFEDKVLLDQEHDFLTLAEQLIGLLQGLLAFGPKDDRDCAGPDQTEILILYSNSLQYDQARIFYSTFTDPKLFCSLLEFVGCESEVERQHAAKAISTSCRKSPDWAAYTLVMGLTCAPYLGGTADEISEVITNLRASGLNLNDALKYVEQQNSN